MSLRGATQARLPRQQRTELAALLAAVREERGWSRTQLVNAAARYLRQAAEELGLEPKDPRRPASIDPQHVEYLEGAPANPVSRPDRRVRLLAIVLALGVEPADQAVLRAKVNVLAGGI